MRITHDQERVSFNLAKLKKSGETFEIVVNPDEAANYKQNKSGDITSVLKDQKIYSDAKKGLLASEERLEQVFNTKDPVEVADIILKEGDIQLTAEHRQKLVEEKKKKIITMIQRYGIDPRTQAPHPLTRIENAIKEAKVKIDEYKSAEDQIQTILKELQPVIPIKFAVKEIEVIIPAAHAGKSFGVMQGFGKVLKNNWLGDGSLQAVIEVPAGLEHDFYDKLNALTHGDMEAKVLQTR